jgi:hypothetical protein
VRMSGIKGKGARQDMFPCIASFEGVVEEVKMKIEECGASRI